MNWNNIIVCALDAIQYLTIYVVICGHLSAVDAMVRCLQPDMTKTGDRTDTVIHVTLSFMRRKSIAQMTKKHFTIKTIDGNRYETDEEPLKTARAGIDWVYFPVKDGVGTKYINVSNIVSITELEVKDE